jgi:hypothetical protein
VLVEKIPVVVKAVPTRPIVAYVANLDLQQNGPPTNIEAALVLNAGDQRAELEAALNTLLGMAAQQGLQTKAESAGDVGDVAWQPVTTPPDAPAVRYGWKDDYFIIAVGETTHTQLLERLGGAAPQWLTELRAEHPIEREYSLGYINVAAILEKVQPIIEAEEPTAWPIIERLGLTHIQAAHRRDGVRRGRLFEHDPRGDRRRAAGVARLPPARATNRHRSTSRLFLRLQWRCRSPHSS